jgi:diguanylate cyclase (GGDEF)-like protein
MYVLSWFDNRTLIFCDFMLAAAFSIVFFGMKKKYPNLRGINTIAISFLLGVPGTFLLASRGSIPYFFSVIVANSFVLASFVFLYRGILRFLGSRRTIIVPVIASFAAIAVLFYFTQFQDRVVPRIVAISVTVGLVRGLIAIELFRKSPGFPSPKLMRVFAASMAFFAAVTVNCGIVTILHGAPINPFQTSAISTATLLIGLVSVCATGLFILILASSDLIERSKDESQKDSLSGAFNRRGIEAKLAAELKRLNHGNQKLSIALIDVDYFKAINDIQGHAAGDAALRVVSEAISNHLRGRDYLGRYGGDEFLLILPQTPCTVALAVTERLNQAVHDMSISTGAQPLTLSIGITEAFPSDDTVSILARADKALYKAKSDGRNCRRVVTMETEDPRHVYRALGLSLKHPVVESMPAISHSSVNAPATRPVASS